MVDKHNPTLTLPDIGLSFPHKFDATRRRVRPGLKAPPEQQTPLKRAVPPSDRVLLQPKSAKSRKSLWVLVAAILVQASLSEGNSGGPALVERDGKLQIAGIVIERRGSLGEMGTQYHMDVYEFQNLAKVWTGLGTIRGIAVADGMVITIGGGATVTVLVPQQ